MSSFVFADQLLSEKGLNHVKLSKEALALFSCKTMISNTTASMESRKYISNLVQYKLYILKIKCTFFNGTLAKVTRY